VALKTAAPGNGQHRAGIQPAAEKDNCFFHEFLLKLLPQSGFVLSEAQL
jgi:hypothetical protein